METVNQPVACMDCGLVQRLPDGEPARDVGVPHCARCGMPIHLLAGTHSNRMALAFAVTALVLFFPSILLPMLTVEKVGVRGTTSLVSGVWHLFGEGDVVVGLVVLVFSILFPLVKLVLLLELGLFQVTGRERRAAAFRWMERIGKWGMLDVLVIALMVMLVKLGSLIQVRFEVGLYLFLLCVVFSLASSLSFDPLAIWKEDK